MNAMSPIEANQRNGNLHINLDGRFTMETALFLTTTMTQKYQGSGNIFIHTESITDIAPDSRQALTDLLGQNPLPRQNIYWIGSKGFDLSIDSTKVIIPPEKKQGGCGRCKNCRCHEGLGRQHTHNHDHEHGHDYDHPNHNVPIPERSNIPFIQERRMKKTYLTKTLILASLLVGATSLQSLAGDAPPASMETMRRQMQELIEQNKQLSNRVGELEGKMGETNAKTDEQFKALDKREEKTDPKKISEYVSLSGLIEVEFAAGDDFAGESFDALDVATVELGLDVKATDWATGHILVKYEEDGGNDDLFIDEAAITLGNQEAFPLNLTIGKFYMPFGNFETNMIQDPLTLEIGEINDTGASIGLEANGFSAALYGYKGMNESGASDTAKGFGVMAGYNYDQDDFSFTGGLSWTNNMADSDGAIADAFDESGLDTIEQTVSGGGIHIRAGFGPVSVIGEYVSALDDFSLTEVEFLGHGAEPKAWNAELVYTVELLNRETVFAVGWQQTDEAVAIGLPESRHIVSAGMEIIPDTVLTLEYHYDSDYDIAENGSGEHANVFTAQLAYQF